MCGITGTVNWGDRHALSRMTDLLAHRGPDDQGIWQTTLPNGDSIGMGSRRLSILDLSDAGHMPMSTEDSRYTIVYNGETYNYPELRQWLAGRGYRFRSNSDTEAVLYLYRELGPDCLRKINGMFALAIWDSEKQELFLARDHVGIKPFYYLEHGRSLAFASEVKAILSLPRVERGIDFNAFNKYLSFLWVPEPQTMFKGVKKLPPGHYAIWRNGSLEIKKYWDLNFPDQGAGKPQNETELAEEVRERFFHAVKSQLISDVPIGAFLSAGLDSSSIVAAVAKETHKPIRTFTITFPERYRKDEDTLDDPRVARRTSEQFGCKHTEIVLEPDVVDLLPRLVYHMDEPTADPAIIACYLVNRHASIDTKVILSGTGGDEVFAGYRKYRAHYLAEYYQMLPKWFRNSVLEPGIALMPSFQDTAAKEYVRLAKKMTRSGSLTPRERFIGDGVYLSAGMKQSLCTPELFAQLDSPSFSQKHLELFENVKQADFLNQMLYVDINTFLVSLNLNYNDKMSMASSVEVRVPFLDRELMEWTAANVPPELKMRGATAKHIFREAMRPVLSAEVLNQKKAGFGAPVGKWLSTDLGVMVEDLLSESNLKKRGFFNPAAVHRLVSEHRSGRQDWSVQIWQLITLELWMNTFMDAKRDAAD